MNRRGNHMAVGTSLEVGFGLVIGLLFGVAIGVAIGAGLGAAFGVALGERNDSDDE